MLQYLRGSRTSSDIPRAKRAKNAKFGNQFLFFAPFAFPSTMLRTCFARDIPKFGCGFPALCPSW
jgi:hypothetical protein